MNTFKWITTERQTPPQAFAERAKEVGPSFVNFVSVPFSEGLRHRDHPLCIPCCVRISIAVPGTLLTRSSFSSEASLPVGDAG